MALNTFLTCPSACDDALLLPAIDAVQDCTKTDIYHSQITDLLIAPSGAPAPVDWTNAGNWTTAIDNTVANNTKIKHLVVTGGIAASEKTEIPMPKRKTKVISRLYTVICNCPKMDADQYDFYRKLQCGDTTGIRVWYANEGHLFGGATGIQLKGINVDLPLGEGDADFENAIITITYEADGDPPRTATVF